MRALSIAATGMNAQQAVRLARNSFEASFIGDEQRRRFLASLEEAVSTFA